MIIWGRSLIPQKLKGDSSLFQWPDLDPQMAVAQLPAQTPVLSGGLLPNEEAGVSSIYLPSTPDPK